MQTTAEKLAPCWAALDELLTDLVAARRAARERPHRALEAELTLALDTLATSRSYLSEVEERLDGIRQGIIDEERQRAGALGAASAAGERP